MHPHSDLSMHTCKSRAKAMEEVEPIVEGVGMVVGRHLNEALHDQEQAEVTDIMIMVAKLLVEREQHAFLTQALVWLRVYYLLPPRTFIRLSRLVAFSLCRI